MKRFTDFLKDPFGKKAREARLDELKATVKAFLDAKEEEILVPTSVTADDIGGYRPLDLKPGDKVKWRSSEFKDQGWPRLDEVVTVYAINPPVAPESVGVPIDRMDFSVLYRLGTAIEEYAHDSRRFVKVEN